MRGSHGFGVVPRQQFFDVRLFVPTCDGCQDTRQIAMRFDPVEFTGLDQGRDDGPVLCACIMSCEERVFTVQSAEADAALDRFVVEFDAAIVEEQA